MGMKEYPSIHNPPIRGENIIAFDKLDGSNVRAEWTRKRGWTKFGRRRGLLDDSLPILKRSPDLILAKYGDDLARIFRKKRWDRVTAFFEFYGPSSFAGWHDPEETQTVTLFDVHLGKPGFLPPRDFVKTFKSVETPAVLYEGRYYADLAREVREGLLEGMTFEGVVCKSPRTMFKLKTQAWYDRLKGHCGDDEAMFERLK